MKIRASTHVFLKNTGIIFTSEFHGCYCTYYSSQLDVLFCVLFVSIYKHKIYKSPNPYEHDYRKKTLARK